MLTFYNRGNNLTIKKYKLIINNEKKTYSVEKMIKVRLYIHIWFKGYKI